MTPSSVRRGLHFLLDLAGYVRMILRKLLGLFCLALGACLFCVNAGAVLRAWNVAEQGLSLLTVIGGLLALAILGAGLDLLAQRRPAAPQKPPPTRDAWNGQFSDMNSASDKMSKGR